MLRDAHRWGYVRTNQAEYVQKPRMEKQELDLLDPSEIGMLLKSATEACRLAFNMTYISSQLGHSSITITMDRYGDLFNDRDCNRSQAALLETVFGQSVRKPLEKGDKPKEKGVQANVIRAQPPVSLMVPKPGLEPGRGNPH
jgi:hypothetical protein